MAVLKNNVRPMSFVDHGAAVRWLDRHVDDGRNGSRAPDENRFDQSTGGSVVGRVDESRVVTA